MQAMAVKFCLFFIKQRQQKRELVKTITVKLYAEMFIVSFLDAVATVDIPRSKQ